MGTEHESQLAPEAAAGSVADRADEATRKASSADQAPESHGDGQAAQAPAAPAGEPEAPVAPGVPAEEPAPDDAEDHERRLERDVHELSAKAEKADEYLELAKRTKADFENYRRRAVRDAAAAQERGVAKLAKELLPAVDNLDRALEVAEAAAGENTNASENGSSSLVSGIKLVHADVLAALSRVGIERFSPEGDQFDPQHHEAVAHQPIDGARAGTVVEVYQRGYRLGDTVLRPARVVVAK